jgi:nicotinate-nucleotide adenylyltransferase
LTRIAIFGGTFDPVHSAHLVVARGAIKEFALDKVLFVPASHPPHKPNAIVAGYEHRYRMIELACENEPRCEASRIEEGEGTSYTVLTIAKLRQQSAEEDRLFFLIGADAFREIQSWYRWQDVVRAVEFIVVTRPGHDYAAPADARIHRLETVALPVSSSAIRDQLARGEPAPDLPAPVAEYIRAQGLYR